MLLLCVLKIKNIATCSKIITPAVIFTVFAVYWLVCSSFMVKKTDVSLNVISKKKHPFYISVIDIKHDPKAHNLNISIKLFTNDIENALKKITTKSIDLLNPKNKPEMELELMNYIKQRFSINVNLKPTTLNFIGYEREEDAIWVYLEVKKVIQPKILKINTKLLYDFLPLQTNIVHAEINGVKKSSKVTNPESIIEFKF
jgi:hypothetical protein